MSIKKVSLKKTEPKVEVVKQKPEKKLTQRKLLEERIDMLKKFTPESEEIVELEQKLKLSKRGKSSKVKGASYERDIATRFKNAYNVDLVRTPQSGGFAKKSNKADDFRGDIISVDKDIEFQLHIECKNQKTWNLKQWLKQCQEDCPENRIPIIIMKKENTNPVGHLGNQQDLVVLDLEDFFKLVNKDKIVKKV